MSDTEASARKLADHIQEYWLRKGYLVSTEVVKLDCIQEKPGISDKKPFWCVRTDMKMGWPVRRIET